MCKDIWHHAGYAREMAISMARTVQEERLRWVLPIIEGRARLTDVSRVCPHSRRSLLRWSAAYRAHGAGGLTPRSTAPCTSPLETPIAKKELVVALRKKKKVCALKLHWMLAADGIQMPTRTIGKILKTEGLVRKYRVRKTKYVYVRAERQPGELMEIDVKYVPGTIAHKRYFQYTAIDCASRWRYLRIFEEQSNYSSVLFLGEVRAAFPYHIRAVKTDNGFVFTNRYTGTYTREDLSPRQLHAFDRFCATHGIVHYLIDPGKPAQNGMVERSHRSDQESFYDRNTFSSVSDLKRKVRIWNTAYNNLMHCGLNGRSPNQYLLECSPQKVPNVLA
jgi:transposase InsO family protein